MIGKTIRETRIAKCILAKDLYDDIMTKSHYIRFEQDLVAVSFDKILRILDRLAMSVEEILFVDNEYTPPQSTLSWRAYANAANKRDDKRLLQVANAHQNDTLERTRIIAHLATITAQNINDDIVDQQKAAEIIKYLTDMNAWTLDEMSIFTSCFYLFSPTAQETMMAICHQRMERYLMWPNYKERMLNLLSNYIYHCYINHRVVDGDRWFVILNQIQIDTTTIYQSFYRELCREINVHVHVGKSKRESIKKLDAQLILLLGSSSLLQEYDEFCLRFSEVNMSL